MDHQSSYQHTRWKKALVRVGSVGAIVIVSLALAAPAHASYKSGGGIDCPGYPGPSSVRTSAWGIIGHYDLAQKNPSSPGVRSEWHTVSGYVVGSNRPKNWGFKRILQWYASADHYDAAGSSCV